MKEQLKLLYSLQQVDGRLEAIKKELAALDSGATLKQQLKAAEPHEKKLEDNLRKAEADLLDAELNLKSIEQKKTTFEKKLYGGGVSNPKELSGIEKEIEALGRNRAQIDEQILKLYDDVEQHKSALKEFQARIAAATQRLERTVQKYEAESKRLTSEKAKLEVERAKAVEGVEPALLRRYDSIRIRAGGIGIAKITDGKCGACHVGITNFTIRKLQEDKEPIFCESCGRLLFMDNE